MTHTPGPWIAVGQSVYAQTPQDIDHRFYGGYNEREEPHGFLISESTPHPATARLIAAAPDLLAALEQMLSDHDELTALRARCGHPPALAMMTLEAAREAIAKAKGE